MRHIRDTVTLAELITPEDLEGAQLTRNERKRIHGAVVALKRLGDDSALAAITNLELLALPPGEMALCQRPVGSARWRTAELPAGGQQNCPFVANRTARGSVGQWHHPLAGGGLGEADAVAGGEDDVGVVQQPVDGCVGDGLGHEFVEPTWNWHTFDCVETAC